MAPLPSRGSPPVAVAGIVESMASLDELAARVAALEADLAEVKHASRATGGAHAFALTRVHAEVAEFRQETAGNFEQVRGDVAGLRTELVEVRAALTELLRRVPPAGE